MNENQDIQSEFQKGRSLAMTFGGLVYTGVVVAATTLFISFILLAFPSDAYFTRAVMAIGGFLVGCSTIAFPIALHNWTVSGVHRSVAVALYYGEMLIMALNTVVSFASLLFKFAGMALPAWIAWYEPFSVISIVYTLFAWGTLFFLDPQIKAKAKEHAAIVKFNERVTAKLDEYLDSIEGEDAIARVAESKIQEKFHPDLNKRRHFGSGRAQVVQPQIASKLQSISDAWKCQDCHHMNIDPLARFCASCGSPREAVFSSNGKSKANP